MLSVRDVLLALNRAKTRYLLIGGLASVLHGVPRTTTDIDLAVDADPRNVERALRALRRIGLVPDTDSVDEILGQGGVTVTDGLSVDLLTALATGTFSEIWRRRSTVRFRGIRVPVVSRADQVRLLRASGRRKDVEDADYLESLR